MTTDFFWPPAFPFPPTDAREWYDSEKKYLARLLQWRWQRIDASVGLSEIEIARLTEKLATPKAIRRFARVCAYEQKERHQTLTYLDWLDRVLDGYRTFSAIFADTYSASGELASGFNQRLQAFASYAYMKHFQYWPTADQAADLASELALSVLESYFFDTEFESWLHTSARNLLFSQGRRTPSAIESIDAGEWELTAPSSVRSSGVDWLQAQIQHDAILQAIRQVPHQRYRVVLLLLYIYDDLSNAELAAFFGVPVPQVTTWKSRARKALRKYYPSHATNEGAED